MCVLAELYLSVNSQMKAVAGLKMSYQVQQAINGSRGAVVRGFRQDDTDAALCSHLYSMVRSNRQHRRAFLISLLNLFDDSSVSSRFFSLRVDLWFTQALLLASLLVVLFEVVMFHTLSHAENRGQHAVVHSRQLGMLPIPDPGGASFYHAPCRYHSLCLWE